MAVLSPQAWNGYVVYGNQNGHSIFFSFGGGSQQTQHSVP